MSKLPVISGKETVKALSKTGFFIHHQKGMLRDIIKDAGLTIDEFVCLLK